MDFLDSSPRLPIILSIEIDISLCIAMLCRSGSMDHRSTCRSTTAPLTMISGGAPGAARRAAVTCRDDDLDVSGLAAVATIGRKTRTVRAHARATALLERQGRSRI